MLYSFVGSDKWLPCICHCTIIQKSFEAPNPFASVIYPTSLPSTWRSLTLKKTAYWFIWFLWAFLCGTQVYLSQALHHTLCTQWSWNGVLIALEACDFNSWLGLNLHPLRWKVDFNHWLPGEVLSPDFFKCLCSVSFFRVYRVETIQYMRPFRLASFT